MQSRGEGSIVQVMTVLTKPRMTVDEYLAWAEDQPGRYELHKGEVQPTSPETAGHADTKAAVYVALLNAIRQRRVACRVFPDGMTVRIDQTTAYEPDAVVYSGEKIARSAVEVPNPLIVVEVLAQILHVEDDEIAGLARKRFEKQGIKILTNTKVTKIEKKSDRAVDRKTVV